jgi:hypothetical protein
MPPDEDPARPSSGYEAAPQAHAAEAAAAEAAEGGASPSTAAAATATASNSSSDDSDDDEDGDDDAERERVTFRENDAYVYAPIPRPTAISGHRAELWDVEKWSAEVSVQVVEETRGGKGRGWVRLFEKKSDADADAGNGNNAPTAQPSGELFAEAPLPLGKALVSVVDPAIDSSRYFAVRVVDRANARRHAVIGLGFRERAAASAFAAALDEWARGAARLREARALRRARRKKGQEAAAAEGGGGEGGAAATATGAGAAPSGEFALREGEKVKIRADLSRLRERARARGAALEDGEAGYGGGSGGSFFDGGEEASGRPRPLLRLRTAVVAMEGLRLAPPPPPPPASARVVPPAAPAGEEDDAFGEFVG